MLLKFDLNFIKENQMSIIFGNFACPLHNIRKVF